MYMFVEERCFLSRTGKHSSLPADTYIFVPAKVAFKVDADQVENATFLNTTMFVVIGFILLEFYGRVNRNIGF